jgi:hypothetical protein
LGALIGWGGFRSVDWSIDGADESVNELRQCAACRVDEGALPLAAVYLLTWLHWPTRQAAWAAAEEFPWVTKGGLLDGVLPESVLIDSLPLNNQGIKGMGNALSRINELRGGLQAGYRVCTEGRVKADLSYVAPGTDDGDGDDTVGTADADAELSTFRWAKIKGLAEVSRSVGRLVGHAMRRVRGKRSGFTVCARPLSR